MHESFFSYNITKPYPYRWFTWLVLLGGLIATVLFSVINLAANGYDPSVIYATDPNETEHPRNPAWFQKRPWSFASKVSSTCQDQILTVGAEFMTNNLGISYKITNLQKHDFTLVPSITYHHDNLHLCNFDRMEFDWLDDSYNEIFVSARVYCLLYDNSSPVTMDLYASSYIDPGGIIRAETSIQNDVDSWISDFSTNASLWWGQQILTLYAGVFFNNSYLGPGNGLTPQLAMWRFLTDTDPDHLYFRPNSTANLDALIMLNDTSVTMGLDQPLSPDAWGLTFGPDTIAQWLDMTDPLQDGSRYNRSDTDVLYLLLLDQMGKMFYSIVLTDLVLNDIASDLFGFRGSILEQLVTQFQLTLPSSQAPNNTDELSTWAGAGIPHVPPATISTRYLCQVPKLKSTGSLIVSIVVADLVLLQALWLLVKWIVSFFLERRHPEARYCSGCAAHEIRSEDPERGAKPAPTSTVQSYAPVDTEEGSEVTFQLLKAKTS